MLDLVLRQFPITHLMLKLDTGPVYPDFVSRIKETYDADEGAEILESAEGWAEVMAEGSHTLQWVGVYVPKDRIRCWELSRQATHEENVPMVSLHEVDDGRAWEMLTGDRLREFI